mgnify:FL=1
MGKAGKEREGPGKSSINCSEGEGHRFESCRVRQLPISRSIFWPVPDCPLEVTSGRKAASRLTTPKQTHADLCCFFNAVDHLAKSNGYLQHPLGSFRRLGEVAARQPTMYPASDAAVG